LNNCFTAPCERRRFYARYAIPFWERLGFARTGGDANYIILTGWECEVHLTQAGAGPWSVPSEHNPFGIFICRSLTIKAFRTLQPYSGGSTNSTQA